MKSAGMHKATQGKIRTFNFKRTTSVYPQVGLSPPRTQAFPAIPAQTRPYLLTKTKH